MTVCLNVACECSFDPPLALRSCLRVRFRNLKIMEKIKFLPLHNDLGSRNLDDNQDTSYVGPEAEQHPALRPQSKFLHWKSNITLERSFHQNMELLLLTIFLLTPPVLYIILGIATLALKGKEVDDPTYNKYDEYYKWAVTIWPIVCSIGLGALFRNIAHYRVRRGARLITLEVLTASRSFGAAFAALWTFGVSNLLVLGLLIVWLTSPLAGQALQRIFSRADVISRSTVSIAYTNTNSIPSGFMKQSAAQSLSPLSNGYLVVSMLAPTSDQYLPTDGWGHPKIPLLEALNQTGDDGWFVVDGAAQNNTTYTSFVGIPHVGVPEEGETDFNLESSYLHLECTPIFENITIQANDTSWWFSVESDSLAIKLDGDRDSSTIVLRFASQYPRLNWYNGLTEAWQQTTCNITERAVESHVRCVDDRCSVDRMRASRLPPRPAEVSPDLTALGTCLKSFASASGPTHSDTPTLQEKYLFNPDVSLARSSRPPSSQESFHFPGFAARLSLLINTYWMAGFAAGLTMGGQPVFSHDGFLETPLTNTTAVLATSRTVYAVHTLWIALFFVCAAILLLAAALSIGMRLVNPVPDTLGYVGAAVRHNPYVPLPEGGSAMDGPDFAHAAADVRLWLADVRGNDKVGYVALTSGNARPLKRRRYYL